MWYSIYTVGDLDIDQEHANIDYMLNSLPADSPDLSEKLCLLIDTILLHFGNEEAVAQKKGYKMLPEHLDTHAKLSSELNTLKSSLASGQIDAKPIPEVLQEMLKLHILEFDRFLLSNKD